MSELSFDCYPLVAALPSARAWLTFLANIQRSPHTVDAYARDLQDYLSFCQHHDLAVATVQKVDIACYVRDLAERPRLAAPKVVRLDSGVGLANATMQRRLTAIRLFYDFLVEDGARTTNPVGRGRYAPGRNFGGTRDRALLRRYTRMPWIPTETQWQALLTVVRTEGLRTRCMFALAYDAGLRREELCCLATSDIEPGKRLLHLRAETTKNAKARVVPFSEPTADLYAAYLQERRALSRARGPLFLSESRRNRAQPISKWTWSKVIHRIAQQAEVPQFTPHTLRHLCLTDLARAGWDLHEIAAFAGHSSIETTRLYVRISGHDLAQRLAAGMDSIHAWRAASLGEAPV